MPHQHATLSHAISIILLRREQKAKITDGFKIECKGTTFFRLEQIFVDFSCIFQKIVVPLQPTYEIFQKRGRDTDVMSLSLVFFLSHAYYFFGGWGINSNPKRKINSYLVRRTRTIIS